ncbi:MAG: sigma-70 family RNA polymerase sigma factor [Chitinophagaceae bacterium]|nr:sigma-70 family RNA polymerase sigma factor [Chitinophagaceae bacterium]
MQSEKDILQIPHYPKSAVQDQLAWTAFRQGNVEAFDLLYHRYFNLLLNKSRRLCADKEMIRDCIQDLFAEIWKNRLSLSTPRSVKAYLLSAIYRKLLRRLREKRSREKQLRIADTIVHSAEEKIIIEQTSSLRSRQLVRAVGELTKRQRQALSLKFYAGMSYPEIADRMAISKRSVYNMVAKAISNLQAELYERAIKNK